VTLSKKDLLRLFKKLPEDVIDYILQFEPAPLGGKLCRELQSVRLCVQVARKLTLHFEKNGGPNECQFAKVQIGRLTTILMKACDFVKGSTGGYDWWTEEERSLADRSDHYGMVTERIADRSDPLTLRWKLKSDSGGSTIPDDGDPNTVKSEASNKSDEKSDDTKSDDTKGTTSSTAKADAGRTFEVDESTVNEGNDLYVFFCVSQHCDFHTDTQQTDDENSPYFCFFLNVF